MTEKEIKDRAEQIVEALTSLSLGREPNMLSNDAFKKLSSHPNFFEISFLFYIICIIAKMYIKFSDRFI